MTFIVGEQLFFLLGSFPFPSFFFFSFLFPLSDTSSPSSSSLPFTTSSHLFFLFSTHTRYISLNGPGLTTWTKKEEATEEKKKKKQQWRKDTSILRAWCFELIVHVHTLAFTVRSYNNNDSEPLGDLKRWRSVGQGNSRFVPSLFHSYKQGKCQRVKDLRYLW